jgi:hypothetical protein
MMLGQTNPLFATADLAYRRERIYTDLHRAGRPLRMRWPFGLINPNRRRRASTSRPMPAPHHAISQ